MRNKIIALTLAAAVSSAAFAGEVAPTEVVFEDGALATSLSGVAGDPANGPKVLGKKGGNCIACHQVSALPELAFQGEIGPPLDGVADRWSEAEIRGIVADAKMTFEGSMMPSFYKVSGFIRLGNRYTGKAHGDGPVAPLLTAQQIEDVVAFLMTLKE